VGCSWGCGGGLAGGGRGRAVRGGPGGPGLLGPRAAGFVGAGDQVDAELTIELEQTSVALGIPFPVDVCREPVIGPVLELHELRVGSSDAGLEVVTAYE
jgi:hypothetical protein